MSGHTVYLTRDGKECASVFREKANCFDAVLMDLQVSNSSFVYTRDQ